MNYYRRYLGDYMKDTMHLSVMEHGAYGLLLDGYYATEKPLPADYESLYRVARAMTKAEQAAVRSVADQFFKVGPDGLRHNPRADEEIAIAQATIEKQRESGVNSGGKRRSTTGSTDESTLGSTSRSTRQPITTNLQPLTTTPQPPTLSDGGANGAHPIAEVKITGATWIAYCDAYAMRYGVEPVRNASVNGQLASLVKRLGVTEAPKVAAFYVSHSGALYVRAKHPVNLLLRDCEGLRTEWATGRTVTEAEARQSDRKQNNLSVAQTLIAESRNGSK